LATSVYVNVGQGILLLQPGEDMPRRAISPTLLARAATCLHSWHLECHGDATEKIEPDAGAKLIMERGLEHEKKMVETLEDVAEPQWDRKDWADGHEKTLGLMREGHPWIYQGLLKGDSLFGFPDLLRKQEGRSELGKHTYIPIDIKGHKAVTKKDRYQLSAYAILLEPILGARPERGGIWLNTGEIVDVDLSKNRSDVEALLSDMKNVRDQNSPTEGVRCSECDECPWNQHCRTGWERDEHLTLLPGATGSTARSLLAQGRRTWHDVAQASTADLLKIKGVGKKTSETLLLHALARVTGRPQVRKEPTFPENIPIHFYDIETFGECVYLHGNIRISGEEREEKQFLARSPEDEKTAWHEYLDYLARDDRALIYCWADYEREHANALWDRHQGNEKGFAHLKNNLVDQCRFVSDHWALPLTGYSIKVVAPFFGFRWQADDAGGLNSEAWYRDWLGKADDAILKKILRYNLDDVIAMEVIDRELRKL